MIFLEHVIYLDSMTFKAHFEISSCLCHLHRVENKLNRQLVSAKEPWKARNLDKHRNPYLCKIVQHRWLCYWTSQYSRKVADPSIFIMLQIISNTFLFHVIILDKWARDVLQMLSCVRNSLNISASEGMIFTLALWEVINFYSASFKHFIMVISFNSSYNYSITLLT